MGDCCVEFNSLQPKFGFSDLGLDWIIFLVDSNSAICVTSGHASLAVISVLTNAITHSKEVVVNVLLHVTDGIKTCHLERYRNNN